MVHALLKWEFFFDIHIKKIKCNLFIFFLIYNMLIVLITLLWWLVFHQLQACQLVFLKLLILTWIGCRNHCILLVGDRFLCFPCSVSWRSYMGIHLYWCLLSCGMQTVFMISPHFVYIIYLPTRGMAYVVSFLWHRRHSLFSFFMLDVLQLTLRIQALCLNLTLEWEINLNLPMVYWVSINLLNMVVLLQGSILPRHLLLPKGLWQIWARKVQWKILIE